MEIIGKNFKKEKRGAGKKSNRIKADSKNSKITTKLRVEMKINTLPAFL